MARVKRSVHSKKRRRAVLGAAEGYSGSRSRHLRKANEQLLHSGQYAYRDRRARKGQFRRLWIVRINAACRARGLRYSQFVAGLQRALVELDRKTLADLAVNDPDTFTKIVELARQCLDHRIPDMATLKGEVATWERTRNDAAVKVDWQFTTADARTKLKRLYPVLEPINSGVAEH